VKACRGSEFDDGMEVADAPGGPPPAQRIPIEADFIYAYSTVPGLRHYLCTLRAIKTWMSLFDRIIWQIVTKFYNFFVIVIVNECYVLA